MTREETILKLQKEFSTSGAKITIEHLGQKFGLGSTTVLRVVDEVVNAINKEFYSLTTPMWTLITKSNGTPTVHPIISKAQISCSNSTKRINTRAL